MNVATLLAVAVALGTDAFSLAIGLGLSGFRRRELLLFPAIVAVLHVLMPLSGLYAGRFLGGLLGQLASALGGAILLVIGGRTLYKTLLVKEREVYSFAAAKSILSRQVKLPVRTLPELLVLALGVSLDALSVGFGLGALGTGIVGAVLTMGTVAGLMTAVGLRTGKFLGRWIGRWAEISGGLILVLIGVKILM